MRKPGRYKVVGSYHVRGLNHVESAPVWISVQPRSDAEMAVYIEGLSAELAEMSDDEAHADLICKLMYTYDARAVPAIVEGMYKSHPSSRRAYHAFRYYMPDDQATIDALYAKGQERGLTNGMTSLLRTRGFTPEQIKVLIAVSLAPENEGAWRFGARAAEAHPDDRFTDRLIAIARGPMSFANGAALNALALNRTDESVAVLKEFLASDDDRMRRSAAHAIRSAYLYGQEGPGRPLRADDFDPIYHEFAKPVHHKVTKKISNSSGTK